MILAVGVLTAVMIASFLTGLGGALAAGPNLVNNPSLETGETTPDCFSRSGWGTEGEWNFVPGREGGRAVSLSIAGHTAGDRKLMQSESTACAPAVTAGQTYEAEIWYQSTVPVSLTVFRHTPEGWSYWGDLKTAPLSTDWAAAKATVPVIPEGTDRISFGLSLNTDGVVITDDYSLTQIGATTPPPPPAAEDGELVVNGNLAAGGAVPDCFLSAGWGEHGLTSELSADVPAGSAAGTRSYEYTMANYVSGDRKLIQGEATGCAPAVLAGGTYEINVDYKASADRISLTVFTHTAAGWGYWTDLKMLPPSSEWTTAQASTPVIPEGVDRLSFGLSISGAGTLKTTNYSLKEIVPVPPPPVGEPALVGSWDVLETEMPLRAIHTTLLDDGRVLLIAGSGNDGSLFEAGTFRAMVWNPQTNEFLEVPVPYDMFCAGHVTLPDGKVLIAGGTLDFPSQDAGPTTFKGSDQSYYFDPEDNTFHQLSDMAGGHWYPTLTKLGNGDVWAAGGLDKKAEGTVLTEMFDYSEMAWLPQNAVPQTWSFWGTYPHMFLLDDGKMFYTGAHTFGSGLPGTGASIYDWRTAQIWDVPGLRQKDLRDQAGSVFIGPVQDQRIMIVGGGNTERNAEAINLVDIIDLNSANPEYKPGPDLPGPGKAYVNLVNLPNRTVLAANGAQYNRAGNVHTAAIYDPQSNSWQSVEADPVGRNYHSTSILLPDGRVAVFGSNPMDNSFEFRISVYSPPYLFQGDRPDILQSPESATYGETLTVQVEGDVTAASLMPPMSSTHQTDTNARLVDLPMAGSGGTRTLQIPDNPNLLPPGPYMLTVLDSAGIPSVAKWVWVS